MNNLITKVTYLLKAGYLTEKEAVLRLSKDYSSDVKIFDSIEQEALEMADYMFKGIANQFCVK